MKRSRPRILAIDDKPANLMILGAALSKDYELQMATSGQEGLAQALADRPDLILLDVMMPEMDGYEVCRRLKADPLLQAIPVIFVTALGDVESESKGLGLGAADYLTKPINVELARLRIHNLLEHEALRREREDYLNQLESKVAERTMALSIAKEAAEAADRAKTAFLGTMSHELRTPLNQIMGMNMLATRLATNPKQADYLDKAKQASNRLLNIVANVLDVAHLEAQHLTLDATRFCPGEIFDALNVSFSPDATARGLELRIQIDPALSSLSVQGDAARLQHVVQTLIDNALKFTPSGHVEVRAFCRHGEVDKVELIIEVEDTGIGIAPENQARIFKAFVQKDDSSTRRYGGSGLGLTICKALVDQMGGKLTVSSELEHGSLFTIELKLPTSDPSQGTQTPLKNPFDLLQIHYPGARVALVVSDTFVGEVLAFLLEDAGLKPVIATTESIEQQVVADAYSWILLDLSLPELDAPGFIARLRQNPTMSSTPVLLIADDTFSLPIRDAMAAGAQGRLTQPIEPEHLYKMLYRFADRVVT